MPKGKNNKSPQGQMVPRTKKNEANFFQPTAKIQKYLRPDWQIVRQFKTVQPTNVVTSTTAATFRSYNFKLSDTSDAAEMASVFDQYRITLVECKFLRSVTESLTSTALVGANFSCIDLDDSNAFSSTTDPLDYTNCTAWEPNEPIQVVFQPHLAQAVYGSGVFSSFANTAPIWIDAASTTVEHYGLKVSFGATTSSVTYVPVFRYHIEFRMSH